MPATNPAVPVLNASEIITTTGNQLRTTSIHVANVFDKRHDDVLKRIKSLDCSDEFNARNFAGVEYLDGKGEKRPAYEMTKDGFVFLVMGFTGKKASGFKESYINAFNEMEKQLQDKNTTLPDLDKIAAQSFIRQSKILMTINNGQIVSCLPVDHNSVVMTQDQLHMAIRDPGFMNRDQIRRLADGCLDRLAGRFSC